MYEYENNVDILLGVFKNHRDSIIKELRIKKGIQRIDSVMIAANIKRMNRLMLFHKVLSNLVKLLNKRCPATIILTLRIHYYNKDFQKAEKYFQSAFDIDEQNFKALLWLSKVHAINKTKHKKALEYLDLINNSVGDHIEARFTKALILIQKRKIPEALTELYIAAEQGKKLALVHFQIGIFTIQKPEKKPILQPIVYLS